MSRIMIGKVHLIAGVLAFALIVTFWTSTIVSEAFGSPAMVASVKEAILWGMLLLIPAMATVGGTGFRLGGKSTAPVIARKRRRMPVIALNGLLILVPAAFFLAARAGAGQFDTAFYAVQAVEILAGAVNITLMSLNMPRRLRDDPQTAKQGVAFNAGGVSLAGQFALPKKPRIAATSWARDER